MHMSCDVITWHVHVMAYAHFLLNENAKGELLIRAKRSFTRSDKYIIRQRM